MIRNDNARDNEDSEVKRCPTCQGTVFWKSKADPSTLNCLQCLQPSHDNPAAQYHFEPDKSNTVRYFKSLYSGCDRGELVLLKTKTSFLASFKPPFDFPRIACYVFSNPGCYLKVNLMDREATLARNKYGVGNENEVLQVVSFHADCDAGKSDKYASQEQMLDAIYGMPLPPSMIVKSDGKDGGFHAYWCLASPFNILSDADRARCKLISERWQNELKKLVKTKNEKAEFDSTYNLDRILRPVGSFRSKSGNYVKLHVLNDNRYHLEQFEAALPSVESSSQSKSSAMPTNIPKKVLIARARKYLSTIDPAISGSGGHDTTMRAATATLIGFDLTIDQARPLLEEYNQRCTPAWSKEEIDHKLEEADKNKTNKVRGWLINDREDSNEASKYKPEVFVTLDEGPVADQVVCHLGNLGWQSDWITLDTREKVKVYVKDGMLVQIIPSSEGDTIGGAKLATGTPRIRMMPFSVLRERITQACQLMTVVATKTETVEKPIAPTKWLIDVIQQRGQFDCKIRKLSGIVTSPTIRKDGSILQTPGWDSETGLLYIPNAIYPAVPELPTKDDAIAACNELLTVIEDFPFQENADRVGWLCLVLTLIGRECIDGCVPLFAFTANIRGSGKGMSVDCASVIAYGRPAARKSYDRDDNDM